MNHLARQLDDATSPTTLLGPGGIGKTTIAHALLRSRPGTFVDLVGSYEMTDVLGAIGGALGVQVHPNYQQAVKALAACAKQRGLLVLDNAEHATETIRDVVHDLHMAGAAILITSRQPLALLEEVQVHVPPLLAADARRLFLARADSDVVDIERDGPPLDRLLSTLGGNALAIELAASRTQVASVHQILNAMHRRDDLEDAAGLQPHRHRSLGTIVRQSWQLLTPDCQRALVRVSTFTGPFTIEDAAAVHVTVQQIQTLRRSSLLRREHTADTVRFRPLEEVRSWLRRHHQPSDSDYLAHADRVSERAQVLSYDVSRSESQHATASLSALIGDLRTLIRRNHSLTPSQRTGAILGLLMHLGRWQIGAAVDLYERYPDAFVQLTPQERPRVMSLICGAMRRQGLKSDALKLIQDELAVPRTDARGEALLRTCAASILTASDRREDALQQAQLAVECCRLHQDMDVSAIASRQLGTCQRVMGRHSDAAASFSEALTLARRADQVVVQIVIYCQMAMNSFDPSEVIGLQERAERCSATIGDPIWAFAVIEGCCLSRIAELGDVEAARPGIERSIVRSTQLGDLVTARNSRAKLAIWSVGTTEPSSLRPDLLKSLPEIRLNKSAWLEARLLAALGLLSHCEGDLDDAAHWYAQASALSGDTSIGQRCAHTLHRLVQIERAHSDDNPWVQPLANALAQLLQGNLRPPAVRRHMHSTDRSLQHQWLCVLAEALFSRTSTWQFRRSGEWFQPPGADRVDLSTRTSAKRVLAQLLCHAHTDRAISVDELIDAGWPGERILADAARNRLYAVIRDLRKRGLSDLIQTIDGGYRLDPDVAFHIDG